MTVNRPTPDLIAVHSLLARYGSLLDRECYQQWSELFTPNGRLEVIGGAVAEGRTELEAFARDAPKGTHVTGNPDVEFVEPECRRLSVTSSWIFLNRRTGSSVGGLYYDDVVTVEDGSLSFASRRIAILTR